MRTFDPTTRRLLAAALCAAASLCVMAPDALALDHDERLHYEVRWRGARVASVNLQTGCSTGKHFPSALVAKNLGLVRDLHEFSIRLDSFISPDTLTPKQGRTRITEEGKTRRYKSTFSPRKATVQATIFGKERGKKDVELPGTPHDLLSWLLHLRHNTTLTPGQTNSYFVWDGWKLVELEATVEKEETIETPLGTYSAFPVTLTRQRLVASSTRTASRSAAKESLGTVWFTTGGDHVMVAMDFNSRVGMANIRLTKASRTSCSP